MPAGKEQQCLLTSFLKNSHFTLLYDYLAKTHLLPAFSDFCLLWLTWTTHTNILLVSHRFHSFTDWPSFPWGQQWLFISFGSSGRHWNCWLKPKRNINKSILELNIWYKYWLSKRCKGVPHFPLLHTFFELILLHAPTLQKQIWF